MGNEDTKRKSSMTAGYSHPYYADSLNEFGIPHELSNSRGWILKRQIPGFPFSDAMGCYPLFACEDWSRLSSDLDDIKDEIISLALVTDPFGKYNEDLLKQCFKDVIIPFKEHFIVDLRSTMNEIVNKHHSYYAKKALKYIHVEKCPNPEKLLDEWIALYDNLIHRNGLKGIKAFSRAAFSRQLSIPGILMFRVLSQNVTIGAQLWYVQGNVAYNHLAAFSPLAYDLGASYALYWHAIEYFLEHKTQELQWLDLGGGAGTNSNSTDGLTFFKKGWSTGTMTAYFCGRIFNRSLYEKITNEKGLVSTDYFPSYRKGEFG